jgi:hypothetical protein
LRLGDSVTVAVGELLDFVVTTAVEVTTLVSCARKPL